MAGDVSFLVDGHNLIAHMPGMNLGDANDEARLVLRLRAYNARTRKRIVVVFDHGLPGGWSRDLSTGPVAVIFAGSHTNADRILIERIRACKNPRRLVVVSSDGDVRAAAVAQRARAISADKFAASILATPPPREETAEVRLSPDEVEEWLQMFQRGSAE